VVGEGVVAHQPADDRGVEVGRRARLRGGHSSSAGSGGTEWSGNEIAERGCCGGRLCPRRGTRSSLRGRGRRRSQPRGLRTVS
jgi:hypothetical protein